MTLTFGNCSLREKTIGTKNFLFFHGEVLFVILFLYRRIFIAGLKGGSVLYVFSRRNCVVCIAASSLWALLTRRYFNVLQEKRSLLDPEIFRKIFKKLVTVGSPLIASPYNAVVRAKHSWFFLKSTE